MENVGKLEQLEPYPQALFDAVVAAIPSWVTRRVHEVVHTASAESRESVLAVIPTVVSQIQEVVVRELHQLLAQDVDDQRNNPLHVLRQSTSYATRILKEAGITEAVRDEFDSSAMPNDVYALGPLTWRDLSEEVHEAGINWGAWKAATVLHRRRAEGKIT